jgi:hypothetical protein
MASTYVNDLRLNEMATGDGSGTWGTTTNTNLELIAEAFSYGTEVITTNADTHTTTIADGATDPGRSLYLKYTGTLDSACTITIGPNTVSKVWIIENGTSGSQDIILSQGSGANITIPAGDTKVVYSDGAGAGAAFFDAFASLSVVDLKVQDDLTVTDDASIGGDATITGTLGVTGVFTGTSLDISGDIDVDGTTNLDVVDIDGAVDMASTLGVTGVATLASLVATTADINGGTIDGTVIGGTTAAAGTFTTFTSTGIDDNADATAITIDSSENVLVGKTTAAFETAGVELKPSGETYVTRASATPLYVRRNTNDGNIVEFWKDGSTVGSIGTSGGDIYIDSVSGGVGLLANAGTGNYGWTSSFIYPTTDNARDFGTASFRFKDLYLSGGVYVGGTGAANLLDDYEEGTWTPDYDTSDSDLANFSIFSAATAGKYTKVGNQVTVYGSIATFNAASISGTGIIRITGLPFSASANTNGGYKCVALTEDSRFTNNPQFGLVSNGTTYLSLYKTTAMNTANSMSVSDMSATNTANFNLMSFVITYMTS